MRYKYIKKPVYYIENDMSWPDAELLGDDVDFMRENNLTLYSGIDIYKTNRQAGSTNLIASLNNDINALVDKGDDVLHLYRSDSAYTGTPEDPGYTNSIKNDDAKVNGFTYGDNISYTIVPSPTIDKNLDLYGRRIFLSDVKANNIKFDVNDEQPPRGVTVDSYDVKFNEVNETAFCTINFKPLNGDGTGQILLVKNGGTVVKEGHYEVSSSITGKHIIHQPSTWTSFKNPPRAGSDSLIPNKQFDRQTDIIQFEDLIPNTTIFTPPEDNPIEYDITAFSHNKQSSVPTDLQVFLTQLKEIAPVYTQISYLNNENPESVVLKWALRGNGANSNYVEIYRGVGRGDEEIILERLGIVQVTSEQEENPDTGKMQTIYEYTDNDIALKSDTDIFTVKYALRLVHERDRDKKTGFQASKFQYYTSNRIGDLNPGSKPLAVTIQKRPKADFKDYTIPALSADEVRRMHKNAIFTKREFKITQTKDSNRTVTLIILEPKSGLYTEKKFNLKKTKID